MEFLTVIRMRCCGPKTGQRAHSLFVVLNSIRTADPVPRSKDRIWRLVAEGEGYGFKE
jgi:hypothetical protein